MKRTHFLSGIALTGLILTSGKAHALDKVTFGTNWLAEAEHGGYYQAVADGTYEKYGLDVKIQQGGPQSSNRLLLASGKIEFYMGSNTIPAFFAVAEKLPIITVAAIFQKDPQILMTHPGQGLDTFEAVKNASAVIVSKDALSSYYPWLKTSYGFREESVKPYTFNPAPFIADKKSAQQGYVTSEPYSVEKQGGFKPNIYLLADYGFDTYSTTIETRPELVATKADLVQRFVDASIVGWYRYLYGDNKKANELIKKDNPEMTDDQIAFSIAKMKEYGVVDSGDTAKLGIGAMTDARMKSFFDKMVKAGVLKADIDYKASYSLAFVNKGVGMDQKPK